MEIQCEECENEAIYLIERRIVITRLKDNVIVADHPTDSYEYEMMSECLCEDCARIYSKP